MLEAKKPLKRLVKLQPLLADIKQGESLRISIAGAAWPAIGINPGHRRKPCGPAGTHCLVVTIKMNLKESKLQFAPLFSK